MPYVSVIIPTYNRASWVKGAIQSVLDQTFSDWELIVVDDGSTDETAQVVAEFGPRVTYVYQANAGACAARNAGFAVSRGELVSFLDSDDCMLPQNLEILVAQLDAQPEVSVAYGWYCWIDEHGRASTRGGPKLKDVEIASPWPGVELWPCGTRLEGSIFPQLLLEETMLMGTSLIRRSCVEAIGGFDQNLQYQEHWDFYLRLAQAGYLYACSKQVVALLRLHSGNRGQELDKMLASRLAIIHRCCDDPAWKARLTGVRQQACYNAYIEHALSNYDHGRFEQGAKCLNEALRYGPLRFSDVANLSTKMISQALRPEVGSPLKFARKLLEPVHSTTQVRRLRRKVLGRVNAEMAIRAFRMRKFSWRTWRHLLIALIYDLSLVRRRALRQVIWAGLVGLPIDRLRSLRHSAATRLVATTALTTSIFVSPHFDDAILSCGGTLADLAQRRAKVILATVFTADPAPGSPLSPLARQLHQQWGDELNPYSRRREEDKTAAECLNIGYCWLGFLEAIYRDPSLEKNEDLWRAAYDPTTDGCFGPMCDSLLQLIEAHPGAIVFAPFGVGHHRDHLLVHQVVKEVSRLTSAAGGYYYYEEFPYAARRSHLAARLAELNWSARPLTIDIADTLQARIRLTMMYKSQLTVLFGQSDSAGEKITAYAIQVGTKDKPRERFWPAGATDRVASPRDARATPYKAG